MKLIPVILSEAKELSVTCFKRFFASLRRRPEPVEGMTKTKFIVTYEIDRKQGERSGAKNISQSVISDVSQVQDSAGPES